MESNWSQEQLQARFEGVYSSFVGENSRIDEPLFEGTDLGVVELILQEW